MRNFSFGIPSRISIYIIACVTLDIYKNLFKIISSLFIDGLHVIIYIKFC